MKSILEVPTDVISPLTVAPEEYWSRVSNYLYAQILESAQAHLLVRIHQRFDLAAVEKVCQAYRLYTGQRGQEADYSVAQLCYALVVRYLNHWSFRKTCIEISTNLLLRWFTGFRVNERTLSYVTLQRFEEWMLVHQPRLLFDAILAQIDQDFPEDAKQAQVGDTFALLARTAPQSHTQLLRNAGHKVIFYLQQVAPSAGTGLWMPPLADALFGPCAAPPEYWLNKEEGEQRERYTAQAADAFLQQVQAHVPQIDTLRTLEASMLRRWLGILRKLLTDAFVITRNATGEASVVRHCTQEERGSFVLGSTVDPEATFRNHGKKSELGYNVQVAATNKFIREIFAATGATSDATGVAALVANQLAQTGHVPPKLIYDRAAGLPKLFHALDKASQGQTQLVARLIDHSKQSGCFGPTHFILKEDGALTCPNGQVSRTFYRAHTADGYQYRFTAQQCRDCPLWQQCRRDKRPDPPQPISREPIHAEPAATTHTAACHPEKLAATSAAGVAASKAQQPNKLPKVTQPKVGRREVFISDYRDWQRRAIHYTTTPDFKLDMAFRSSIERTIACLVRYNGARHATGYGLLHADFQVRTAALAFNLKRWATLMHEKEKPTRRKLAPGTT